MKKTITLLLLLIVTVSGYSQFSKTHYIPPLTSANNSKPGSGAASSTDPSIVQYIYISTPSPSTNPVTVTITPLGGTPVTRTIHNQDPWVYQITTPNTLLNGATFESDGTLDDPAEDGYDNQLFVHYTKTGVVQKDKGFLIEASDLVYANVRVTSSTGDNPLSPSNPSQAGGMVAKGLSAYGTEFRIGGMENKTALDNSNYGSLVNFASFVATEDNTTVTITLPRAVPGVTRFHNEAIYTGPITVNLNKNETYTFAIPNRSSSSFDSNFMLGGLIKSDRNIVVNSGSIGGNSQTTPTVPGGISLNSAGKDYGFDQIVGADKVGKEYIFIGGAGMLQTAKAYDLERVIIIADKPNTQVFKNGSLTPVATLANAGDYYVFNGNDFVGSATAGYNLYVTTSENVFAYQCIAGKNDAGNQNMFFVPPLNCATPSVVNNIPRMQEVGLITYTNTVINITTQATLTDPTPIVTSTNLGPVQLNNTNALRNAVTGKPGFYTYTYPKPGGAYPQGNVSVSAPKQIYVSYYGSNNNATYGSYFSGFDTKPSITAPIGSQNSICLDGTTLSVTSAVGTDQFQWQFSTTPTPTPADIVGATGNSYTPLPTTTPGGKGPGYYYVTKISACSNTTSEPIAVSACPEDTDNDKVFNNVDIDSDNDGITNTNESYGDQNINVAAPTISGTITAGSGVYTNTYTGAASGTGYSFIGNPTGFNSTLTPGVTNSMTYDLNFTKPTSIGLTYDRTGDSFQSQSNAAFEIKTGLNTTLTISNPTNQLLIDTNNDGIYESGVTEFSSFDIKFKLNPSVLSPTPGPPPAIDFKIQTYLATSISFTHQNLSGVLANSKNFSFMALSIPKNSDTDTDADQVDTDSDGDGILDIAEGQTGAKTIVLPLTDANKNGLADNFEPVVLPLDTDLDGVPDFIDLDSDNDGILDSAETTVNTDVAAVLPNTADAVANYRDLDSDGDGCNDVIEAGFTDTDAIPDGKLGTSPLTLLAGTVDAQGKVIGGAYTTPNGNYLVTGVPVITTQPTSNADCATKAATVTIVTTNVATYKWEVSTNGLSGLAGNWAPVVDGPTTVGGPIYSGATTNVLSIADALNGYIYRVNLSNAASACKTLLSAESTVTMGGVPVATDVTMEQCDTDLDGNTTFDLTSKNALIATAPLGDTYTFTYYTTLLGAQTADTSKQIPNADITAYTNSTPFAMDVFVRVQNQATCSDVAKIALTVGVQAPAGYVFPAALVPAPVCDDAILGTSTDGISQFNLTQVKADIQALYPAATATSTYTVDLYETQAHAIAQSPKITNIAAYRNTTPNNQDIWVRVNNSNPAFSGCYTLQRFFVLNVEALPIANVVTIPNQCDDNHDGKFTFNTAALESTLLGGQTGKTVTYFDAANAPLKDANGVLITSPFPATFTTNSQIITAKVENNTPQKCAASTTIQFVVETKPTANPVIIPTQCDDNHDGIFTFNTATLESTLKGTQTGVNVTYFDATNAPLRDANGVLITSPFPPTFASTSQTITAVVTNNAGLLCSESTTIQFTVEAKPIANPVIIANQCDDNHDGKVVFNTATLESTVLGTQSLTNVTVTYFDAAGAALPSPFPATFNTASQIIKAVVTNKTGLGCSESTNISFVVETKPTANTVTIPTRCDDNLDGILTFSTTTLESTLKGTQTGVTITYFDAASAPLRDANGVLITSPFPASFTTTSQTITAVVTNNTGLQCSESTTIQFTVEALPTANAVTIPNQCDDNHDGKVSFNTAALESTLLGTQTGVTPTYFDAANNPLRDANGVLITSPFPANFTTTSQTIKAVVSNNTPQGCSAQTMITFTVEGKPYAYPVTDYRQCDDDNNPNGEVGFSTTNLQQQVLGNQSLANVNVSYFEADGVTPLTLTNPFITASKTIIARVTNNTGLGCSEETSIKFIVDVKPVIATINPLTYTECDDATDPLNQDGKFPFTVSSAIHSTILAAQTDPSVMIIKYFAQDGSPLLSPLPAAFLTGTQTIDYTVENINNASCIAQGGKIQFTVNPLPVADLNADGDDDEVICINDPSLTFDLTAGVPAGTNTTGYTYQWSKDGVVLTGQTSDTLQDVNTEGIYTVVVDNGNCDVTRVITVGSSEIADIKVVAVTDLTDNNTITITVTGRGNYEYALDDKIGYYQDSNVFTNVSPGTHFVHVRDKNGCGIESDVTTVIGVPKFFTPNGDGYNDNWNIEGIDPNTKYTIFIYDRYGKLLKELIPQSVQGWDGTFNLAPMPGSDYWYSLKLDNGREAKGHFSLKR